MKRIHFSLALPKWHEWLVYGSVALLTGTGLAWLVLDHFGKIQGEFGPESNPALPWLLSVHGVLTYVFLVAAAMLIPVHIRLGWNVNRNRSTGMLVAGVAFLLAASGLLLYYASGETLRALASAVHWIIGLGLPALLLWHVLAGKASGRDQGRG